MCVCACMFLCVYVAVAHFRYKNYLKLPREGRGGEGRGRWKRGEERRGEERRGEEGGFLGKTLQPCPEMHLHVISVRVRVLLYPRIK